GPEESRALIHRTLDRIAGANSCSQHAEHEVRTGLQSQGQPPIGLDPRVETIRLLPGKYSVSIYRPSISSKESACQPKRNHVAPLISLSARPRVRATTRRRHPAAFGAPSL